MRWTVGWSGWTEECAEEGRDSKERIGRREWAERTTAEESILVPSLGLLYFFLSYFLCFLEKHHVDVSLKSPIAFPTGLVLFPVVQRAVGFVYFYKFFLKNLNDEYIFLRHQVLRHKEC